MGLGVTGSGARGCAEQRARLSRGEHCVPPRPPLPPVLLLGAERHRLQPKLLCKKSACSGGMQCTYSAHAVCMTRSGHAVHTRRASASLHRACSFSLIAANFASLVASSSCRPTALAARCRARAVHASVSASCHPPGARRRATAASTSRATAACVSAASSACTSLSTAAATARCRNAFCAVPCNRSPRSPLAASSRAYMCMCMCMCTCTCMCMHICSAHVSAGPTHLPVRLPTLPVGPSLAPPLFVYCPSPAAPPPPRLPSDTPQSGRGAAPPLRPSRWTRCGCTRWRRSCSGCERRTGALVDPHAQTPGRGR